MKKVFISVPMKGRKKEDIEWTINALKSAYRAVEPDAEFINTEVQEQPPYELNKEHTAVWYLGKSIQLLSQCDVLLTLNRIYDSKGCKAEIEISYDYGIKVVEFPKYEFAPDLRELERKAYIGEMEKSLNVKD